MTDDDARKDGLRGLGETFQVTPDAQHRAESALTREYDYAVSSGTHMWTLILTHKATERLLDAQDGKVSPDEAILDLDTLLGSPAVACYVCEVAYQPRLRRRRCPGDPNPPHAVAAKRGAR